ncbi:putative ADP-ribosylation factor-binding protein GGA1 [Apostichopus japonicus]|uniref:Putative ADP-ribosylation factor-binding protein GGA1 n=1 Tax=Stichopus japonicus TaxID=307972 RepID=A0A2G8KG45_STIJA|nr:putative ADP-ribosylation factor-binding protein GGA1 [Apostichopus japonicus]
MISDKATNPLNREEDWEFILTFCDRVNFELEGPQIACRLIGHKIQSPQEREALQALIVAEACVKNCGEAFHREVGKFRFLNELIKLISPKYLGARTTEKVKKKTIEIMYSWQIGLPHEPKVKEAYEMLKKQGLVKEDPEYVNETFTLEPSSPRMADFEDEDKAKLLSRLLKSKHAEDLQAANRLIKNMVKEDEKKTEKKTKRMNDLESCNNSVKLLNDMLVHFDPAVTSEGERDLMRELYQTCERLRPNLFRLASDADEKDDGIADILKTNDALVKVMEDYKAKFGEPGKVEDEAVATARKPHRQQLHLRSRSLIDFGGSSPVKSRPTAATNGTDQPMLASAQASQKKQLHLLVTVTFLLDLNSSASSAAGNSSVLQRTNPSDLDNLLGPSPTATSVANVQAINAAQSNIPFTQAAQPVGTAYAGFTQAPGMDVITSTTNPQPAKQEATKPVDTFADLANLGKSLVTKTPAEIPPKATVNAVGGETQPITAYEKNSVKTVVHFGKDSPRPDIKVMVVSTMSTNTLPVKNLTFQAAVPKTMRVKLQPASAENLPAFNPILPAAAITQVMLLANPQKHCLCSRCFIVLCQYLYKQSELATIKWADWIGLTSIDCTAINKTLV